MVCRRRSSRPPALASRHIPVRRRRAPGRRSPISLACRARLGTDGVRSVGHLHAAADATDRIVAEEPIFDAARIRTQFQERRLAAHQMPGTRHHVQRRNTARACPPERIAVDVDRIERSRVRTGGRTSITTRGTTDMRMRVDEPGHDHTTGKVVNRRAVRHLDRRTDGNDPARLDD